MRKYTKPTVEVVELSVKESLSDLPGGVKVGKPELGSAKFHAYVATLHTQRISGGKQVVN